MGFVKYVRTLKWKHYMNLEHLFSLLFTVMGGTYALKLSKWTNSYKMSCNFNYVREVYFVSPTSSGYKSYTRSSRDARPPPPPGPLPLPAESIIIFCGSLDVRTLTKPEPNVRKVMLRSARDSKMRWPSSTKIFGLEIFVEWNFVESVI